MSPEEKEQKKKENKDKAIEAARRRAIHGQRLEQLRLEEVRRREEQDRIWTRRGWRTYEVINQNDYELALYWGDLHDVLNPRYTDGDEGPDMVDDGFSGKIHFWEFVGAHSSKKIHLVKESHKLVIFPKLEVTGSRGGAELNIFNESSGRVILLNQDMKDYEGAIIIVPHTDYRPPKTELEQWKECGLKSNYLLQQIIMLGGRNTENPTLTSDLEKREEVAKNEMAAAMGRFNSDVLLGRGDHLAPRHPAWNDTKWQDIINHARIAARLHVNLIDDLAESRKDLMRRNENLEPVLDMIEDIQIPPHTEYDKEKAGIPSTLTNIT